MKEIREPSRLTPVIAETDVLVVGSGPGGLAAAVSSARAGVPAGVQDLCQRLILSEKSRQLTRCMRNVLRDYVIRTGRDQPAGGPKLVDCPICHPGDAALF
jgi:hypothetical protein